MNRAAGILFTDGRSILLLKRSKTCDTPNTWSTPGGESKEDESPIQNAIRETKEETGLDHIPGKPIGSHLFTGKGLQFKTFVYLVNKKFSVTLNQEHTAQEWIDFNSLESKKLHPSLKAEIEPLLKLIRSKTTNFAEWYNLTSLLRRL